MEHGLSDPLVQGAIVACSTANMALQAWLGLTVLLGSDRRRPGLWLTASALLAGAAFFTVHTLIAGHGVGLLVAAVDFGWLVGWCIGLLLPLAWHLAVLWHLGFWEGARSELRVRHARWLALALGLALPAVVAGVLLQVGHPLAPAVLRSGPGLLGWGLLLWVYLALVVLCAGLTLDALRHPGPTARLMGEGARLRSRPWLAATTLSLLLVSLTIAVILATIAPPGGYSALARAEVVVLLDLAACVAVAAALVLLGQATVAYGIFTGRALPRNYLRRRWHGALLLSLLLGVAAGGGLCLMQSPVSTVLACALLATAVFALSGGWSQAERERHLQSLRPLAVTPNVYDALLQPEGAEVDGAAAFSALCREVLDAGVAYLVPTGPLSAFAGPALAFPSGNAAPSVPRELYDRELDPSVICVSLSALEHAGATWAVPLWSQRGLVGMLLLGDKSGGGLYTQEEIEIARDACERLLDTLASARMGRQLVEIQRTRLAEGKVADHRARRVLHDDVLPRLHATILELGAVGESAEAVGQLVGVHQRVSDLLHEMPPDYASEVSRGGLAQALRRAVEDEFPDAFSSVEWSLSPEAVAQMAALPALPAEVLFHAAREAVRNAAKHGGGLSSERPSSDAQGQTADALRPLNLRLSASLDKGLCITVQDDGVGFDTAAAPRGRGIALHSTMLAIIGGELRVESAPGVGTRVRLGVPVG